ncbi:MAG: purine-nucleoside phosphorylase [Bacilli bacterium]|nr:purine-nucleoside phosphorylase [Bacilli bacterium]
MMTPHIEAQLNEIAKTVLMPGDPLRAKYVAEKYLTDVKLVNTVRNIFAYTGKYKGEYVTVMASGMGMPSIGIYSYELYNFYNVENIIRIGSAGAYSKDINLYDVVLTTEAYSKSSFANVQGYDNEVINASETINNKIKEVALKTNKKIIEGRIHSSDVFYSNVDISDLYNNKKCLCVEMESFALFYNALKLNKNAACLLTISDNLETKEETTSLERQNSFNEMIELALDTAIEL